MGKHSKNGYWAKAVPAATLGTIGTLVVATTVVASTFDVEDIVNVGDRKLIFDQEYNTDYAGNLSQQTDGNGINFGVAELSETDTFDYYEVATIGGTRIDARVTVMELVDMQDRGGNTGVLEILDSNETGDNDFMNVGIDFTNGTGNSYAELKLEFFTDIDTTPVAATLQNFYMSTYDIDNDQYLEINNFDDYQVASNTTLDVVPEVRTGFTRFLDNTGENYSSGTADSRTKGRVTVEFASVSSITFRLGKIQPAGTSSTSSADYQLDFSVGKSWLDDAGNDARLPIPTPEITSDVERAPATYTGPIPKLLDSCVLETGGVATLSGERLSKVTSASVESNEVTILSKTETELRMEFPAMEPGTYDVEYGYASSGKLTHLSSLKVCEEKVVPERSFYVYERFANYRGDRGAVVASDREAIEEFIDSNPGLNRVTCVGSTSGVPALSTDPALAKARAANACSVVEELVPGVTTREAFVTGRGIGQFHRAVILYGVGTR